MNDSESLRRIMGQRDESIMSVEDWSEQKDFFDYLVGQASARKVLLHGFSVDEGSTIIRSFLVPQKTLDRIPKSKLYDWEHHVAEHWSCGQVWGGGEPSRVEFNTNSLRLGQQTLSDSQPLVFHRTFEGRSVDKNYYEVAQFFCHAHGLHWVPEQQAWCKFDDEGDIERSIELQEITERGEIKAVSIVVERDILELHLTATSTVLVQIFDCTRVQKPFNAWPPGPEAKKKIENTIFYKQKVAGIVGSYSRGVNLIRPQLNSYELGAKLDDQAKVKEYEAFITQDVKNGVIATVSCSPEALASYFEPDSDLPYQISPVFFDAAVLNKYKQDPDKYSMDHRSITCRNSWHLTTYDINDAGQVHTYITYLGNLPLKEQRYWKSFNENPKGTISKRAYNTDIQGSFHSEADPLQDLIRTVKELHTEHTEWFDLKSDELTSRIHLPTTPSIKEWDDVIISLSKMVVESFVQKPIQKKALGLGSKTDPTWRSIKWMTALLDQIPLEADLIEEVTQPFKEVQFLRSKLSAHVSGQEAAQIRADLLRKHKTSKNHIVDLCDRLNRSLGTFAELYEKAIPAR